MNVGHLAYSAHKITAAGLMMAGGIFLKRHTGTTDKSAERDSILKRSKLSSETVLQDVFQTQEPNDSEW